MLNPGDLINLLATSSKRATNTKHYRRVGVVSIGWDYDGPSKDGTDNNFTALSTELTDLLRDCYNYETFHITLPSGKDNTRYNSVSRNAAAYVHLVDKFEEIKGQFNHYDCALIIVYRGHSVPVHIGTLNSGRSDTAQHTYGTHPNGSHDGMELFLTSGKYPDPAWIHDECMCLHIDDERCADEVDRAFYHTQISYQSLLLKDCLANFKGTTAILLDCAFAGVDVAKGNQSLLAACRSEQAAVDGPLSLTANVVHVLREAAEKERWVSWGGLHGNLLLRSLRQYVIANRPIWQSNERKGSKDVSFMFRPLPKREGGETPSSPSHTKGKYEEWNNSLPACSVILAASVPFWKDRTTAWFNEEMMLKPDGGDALQPSLRYGMITNVLRESFSTWVQFRIDARVFHEIADHPALTFVSGPHEPMAWLMDGEKEEEENKEEEEEEDKEDEEWVVLEE